MIGWAPRSLLFTTNRTHLSLCVDGAGGFSVSEAEVELVRQALEDAVAVVPSLPTEYGQRTVSEGCPPATALVGRPVPEDEPWTGSIRVTTRPGVPERDPWTGTIRPTSREVSPHRLFIYFVAPDAYATHFGTRPYFRTQAEMWCGASSDECVGVTSALYVPPSASSGDLGQAVIEGLSLRPLLQQE